jgi:hypothetical protein
MVARGSVPLLLCAFLGPGGDLSAAQWTGIVQEIEGPTTCQSGETHTLSDPCLFTFGFLESSAIDLDAWECRYVTVEGPTAGADCTVLNVQQISTTVPSCRDNIVLIDGMSKEIGGSTVIEWRETVLPQIPCRESFDVILGMLPLSADETAVDLGAVLCIDEDTEADWTIDATPDPEPGEGYFYLVRPNGAPDFQSYGSSSDGQVRIPSIGDCVQ